MAWRYRKTHRFGPLRVTVTDRGVRWYLKFGSWTWRPGR